MRQRIGVWALLTCGLIFLAACNSTPFGTSKSTGSSNPASVPASVTGPSVYIVDDTHSTASSVPSGRVGSTIDVFPQSASGSTTPMQIPGTYVSLDAKGNVYALLESATESSIVVYAAGNLEGTPSRSLPVGAGTKIPDVKDVLASPAGEIYVSDGHGIAVFSSTATGDVDPDRYIIGVNQTGGGISTEVVPGQIALDKSGNLYVENTVDESIVVFDSADSGTVVPKRTISYPMAPYIAGMATDDAGNLYVSCIYWNPDGSNSVDVGVLEFDSTASGNTPPKRIISGPLMGIYAWISGLGIAVDSAGTIYLTAGTLTGTQEVVEFSADASGNVAPSKIVTLSGWTDTLGSRIALH